MTLVAGASQYVSTVAYNTSQGVDALTASGSSSLLSGFDSTISLLEIGKQYQADGIGLSASARSITSEFLSQSQSGINVILSSSAQNTIDGANTQIKALQARLPASSIGTFSSRYDRSGAEETSSATTGSTVDTEA